jgi:hypothetical protein
MAGFLFKQLRLASPPLLLPALLAGSVTGVVGVAAFGIIHAYLIEPIWRSLLAGVPFGIIGGVAIGWAFYELYASGKASLRVRGGARFGLLLWLMLVPMTLFALLLHESGMRDAMGDWEDVAVCIIATSTGMLVGWMLTRSWRAAAALGAAVLCLTLAMGGPIAVMHSGRAAGLFGAFLPIYVVCGISLVLILSLLLKVREQRRQKPINT